MPSLTKDFLTTQIFKCWSILECVYADQSPIAFILYCEVDDGL